MAKYHIAEDKTVKVCVAEVRGCRFGSHFTDVKQAQDYANKLSDLIYGEGKTVEVRCLPLCTEFVNGIPINAYIEKPRDSGVLIKTKGMEHVLKKFNNRVENVKNSYNKVFKKNRTTRHEQEEIVKNDERYTDAFKRKEKAKSFFSVMLQQREQVREITKDLDIQKSNRICSGTSASFYFIQTDISDTIKYFEEKGYDVMIRPGALESDCLQHKIRIADHLPKEFLNEQKENKDLTEDDVWDYTEVNVLVSFKKVKQTLKDNEYENLLKKSSQDIF